MSQGLYERTTGQRHTHRRKRRTGPIIVILLLIAALAITGTILLKACAPEPASQETLPQLDTQPPEAPSTAPTQAPTTLPTEEPTQETTEAPTEQTTEATTEATTEPTEETTEPTEETTEPTEDATEESTEPDAATGEKIADLAKDQVGKSYAYGGNGPDTFDTSGLVYYCCKQAGISVPRTTDKQASRGTEVAKKDLEPGDVVFFWTSNPDAVEYQGIYIGGGKFIAARNPEKPVSELDLNWEYFEERYLFARRYW